MSANISMVSFVFNLLALLVTSRLDVLKLRLGFLCGGVLGRERRELCCSGGVGETGLVGKGSKGVEV